MLEEIFIVVFGAAHDDFGRAAQPHVAPVFKQVQSVVVYSVAMVEHILEPFGKSGIRQKAAPGR